MKFFKYHALGNDYIIIDPAHAKCELTPSRIKRICHRNLGIGSDGILAGPFPANGGMGLKIFNPDGSEAEKSGNGLRIFSRYLWDQGLVGDAPFSLHTPAGKVTSTIDSKNHSVTVEMGRVRFDATRIPVVGPQREVLQESICVDGREFTFSAATIGNPHCVIIKDEISISETKRFGPLIETDPRFPHKINVQFMKVKNRREVQLEIWERGAGYTLASGSSSCAAAAVARRLDLVDKRVTVQCRGGDIEILLADDYSVTMSGKVTRVAEGTLSEEIFR